MSSDHPIILAGDPHGEHQAIIDACLERKPGTLIVLGDFGLKEPLKIAYAAVLDAGWTLRYIHGNHDTDSESLYDNLIGDAPEWNIHGKCIDAGGLLIGGLGGVFKGRIWEPREGREEPGWPTQAAFAKAHRARWRQGLPLGQRDTIWPDDVAKLSKLRLNVLVTHEAPLPHKYGYGGLNVLAEACRARLLVHGHHHKTYGTVTAVPGRGVLHIQGVGKAEPWLLEMPE